MRRIVIVTAIAALAGCAPLTPEQQQEFYARWQANAPARAAADAAQQQAQQQQYQQQMNAINSWGAANAARAGTNCTTSYVGQTAYTHCQ